MKYFLLLVISSLIAPGLILASELGGSLECKFLKNSKQEIPVINLTKEIDEEEYSEYYLVKAGEYIEAEIIYLPFQEGIYLVLKDKKRGVHVLATDHSSANLTYNTPKDRYMLNCHESK